MWKTSGLLIYVLVPRSFCEILRGGLFLHFLLSRLKKNILVNCIYGIIPLTGRGRGYVRWPCLVKKLCPDPALSSGPAQLTSMAWGSGQSKPSLFHLKNCYNMIFFFCWRPAAFSVSYLSWWNGKTQEQILSRGGGGVKFLTAITGKVVILIKPSSPQYHAVFVDCCNCFFGKCSG